MSEEKTTGVDAQLNNIRAAVKVGNMVRSTLGPAGMDKLLTDGQHDVVTNDGVTILRELDIAHPGGKFLIEAANTQEATCKDGTTSVVVLAGQMLALSEGLLMRGVHPQVIRRAWTKARDIALGDGLMKHVRGVNAVDVAKTALRGKATESDLEHAANLCIEVARTTGGNLDWVNVVTQTGGSLQDSYVQNGIVLNKEFANNTGESFYEDTNVLILHGGLQGFDLKEIQMQVSDPAQIQAIKEQEMAMLAELAAMVAGVVGEGVVFVRDSVHEAVVQYLAQKGIAVVTRLRHSDLENLSRLLRVPVFYHVTDVTEDYNPLCSGSDIRQERIGDLDFVTVAGPGEATTLVVRGATRQTLDEFERAFDDAIGVVCLAMKDEDIGFPGGGAAYSLASSLVREYATLTSDMSARERMCIEAYADALEIIPAAIASNAGMDPLDVVMELRSSGPDEGLYIDEAGVGSICHTLDKGVAEPATLVTQVIKSATEVACSILRIDDIIARRTQE